MTDYKEGFSFAFAARQTPGRKNIGVIPLMAVAAAHGVLAEKQMSEVREVEAGNSHNRRCAKRASHKAVILQNE
jgi:hypothetical protein